MQQKIVRCSTAKQQMFAVPKRTESHQRTPDENGRAIALAPDQTSV